MAVFYLQHTGKGKAAYDRQGIVNHGRYVLRKSARGLMETRHAPEDYGQVLGWLGRLYDESRANARVIDTLIVNLPRELNQTEQAQLLRTYLDLVTKGRTPYLFVIHTDKPDNPHAHIIIRDADIGTGRRVAGLSKLGSSQTLRALWEALCNRSLRDHGIAISRHGKNSPQHRALNNQAQLEQNGNTDSTLKRHQMPPPSDTKKKVEPPYNADTSKGTFMADVIPFPAEPAPEAAGDNVIPFPNEEPKGLIFYNLTDIRALLETDAELSRLDAARTRIRELKGELSRINKDLETTTSRLAKYTADLKTLARTNQDAAADLRKVRWWFGMKRGFSLLGWKSPKRVAAERAYKLYHGTKQVIAFTEAQVEATIQEHKNLSKLQERGKDKEAIIRDAHSTYGTDEEIKDAGVYLACTKDMYMTKISEASIREALKENQITSAEADNAMRLIRSVQRDQGYGH